MVPKWWQEIMPIKIRRTKTMILYGGYLVHGIFDLQNTGLGKGGFIYLLWSIYIELQAVM